MKKIIQWSALALGLSVLSPIVAGAQPPAHYSAPRANLHVSPRHSHLSPREERVLRERHIRAEARREQIARARWADRAHARDWHR